MYVREKIIISASYVKILQQQKCVNTHTDTHTHTQKGRIKAKVVNTKMSLGKEYIEIHCIVLSTFFCRFEIILIKG